MKLAVPAALLCALGLMAGCASTPSGSVEFLSGYARSLAWSPDGRQITALRQDELVVHEAATLKPILKRKLSEPTFVMTSSPGSVAYAPDGKAAATAADGIVTLWDTSTWQPQRTLKDAEGATALVFTPDGARVVAAGPSSSLAVFDVASGTRLTALTPSPSGVLSLAISPDGRSLATGEMNHQVRVWRLDHGEPVGLLDGHFAPVLSVAYSGDGKLLASSAGGRDVRLHDVADPTHTVVLLDPSKPAAAEEAAAAVASIASLLGAARTSQLTGAPAVAVLGGPGGPPKFNCPVTFSPDGRYIAIMRLSHEFKSSYHVEVYDVKSGARISRNDSGLSALAFSPDGRRLAVSGILRVILLDPFTGKEVSELE